jgi:2-methylcitrate dehydratase PrpD
MARPLSATRQLASYAAETKYADLPEAVIAHAKLAIRDSIGCLIGGSSLAAGKRARDLILPMAANGSAAVAGAKRRIAPALASYINAQLTNLMDYDDTLEGKALGHPGATIVPAALALAEEKKSSGKEFLTAVVVAYDVYSRIAAAGKPSFERNKQVRGLSNWQVFSAAAAAARILGLDAEATARAFGLAALHAPVPFVGKFYEERPIWALKNNFGWAAMGGVMAAIYAAQGFDANHEILEGQTGFWVMAGSDQFESSVLTQDLGHTFSIFDVSLKPYSSCRHTHSTLDALSEIIRERQVRAEDVRAVRVCGGSKIQVFADYRPRSFIDAQFSLPYTAAMLLLRAPTGYGWLDGEPWHDPNVLALADRIRVEADPSAEAELAKGYMWAKVSVELEDGRVEQAQVIHPRGDPRNPMTQQELEHKFLSLAERETGRRNALELNELCCNLDDLNDVGPITEYLCQTAR